MRVYCKTPFNIGYVIYISARNDDCMTVACHVKDTRFSPLFGHVDIRNKNNVYGLHMISRGMHASDIILHSGKNCHFLHAQITSVRGWDNNLANL